MSSWKNYSDYFRSYHFVFQVVRPITHLPRVLKRCSEEYTCVFYVWSRSWNLALLCTASPQVVFNSCLEELHWDHQAAATAINTQQCALRAPLAGVWLTVQPCLEKSACTQGSFIFYVPVNVKPATWPETMFLLDAGAMRCLLLKGDPETYKTSCCSSEALYKLFSYLYIVPYLYPRNSPLHVWTIFSKIS